MADCSRHVHHAFTPCVMSADVLRQIRDVIFRWQYALNPEAHDHEKELPETPSSDQPTEAGEPIQVPSVT